jgi:hypothetical protein
MEVISPFRKDIYFNETTMVAKIKHHYPVSEDMKRSILYLALLSVAFISSPAISQEEEKIPPENWTIQIEEDSQATAQPGERYPLTEEEVNRLSESAKLTGQCVKECRELEEKIQPPADQLQNLVKQQQNLQDQLIPATDQYLKTIDLCKMTVFEEKNSGTIRVAPQDPETSDFQEMGWIIPPECKQTLAQIEKDIASTLNQLAELLNDSDASKQMINKQEKHLNDCLKSCEEIHKEGQPISEKIKNLMEQGIAPPSFISALARYDAVDERMRRRLRLAEEGAYIRESIIAASKKVSRTLVTYEPSLRGIPISRKTSWQWLGFSNSESITREAAPYSGGTYIPASLEKPFKKMGISQQTSLPKLIQKRDIPRFVKIVAPETAVPNMPLSLSIFDEKDVPIPGLVIETDSGKAFKSDESGKVHIPSLTDESDMVVLRAPGTSSGAVWIGFSQEMTVIPELDAPLHVDSASAIVLLGSIETLRGSGFDGFSGSTEINIEGRKLTSIAESPVSLKYKIPVDLHPGYYTVTITEKFKKTASIPILCIKLDLLADRADLKKGESIKGRIHLEGTEKPLLVELINNSPTEISIEPYRVPVKEGKGEFEIIGMKPGPFRITVGAVEFPRRK